MMKPVYILIGFTLLLPISSEESSENAEIKELPFCGNAKVEGRKRLVFVSTLDGKVSALNVDNGGTKQWSISTGPGQMLSSSIHNLELTNNGQWVRMIPSLSGALYKFDGDNIVPVPVTADKLLQSSFRYSDDTVISGGKESRTYGVDASTGDILYECSMNRCDNLTSSNSDTGDIVIIQRQTQTVRAVEPRSGVERWNFSVGQHHVNVAVDPSADCHSKGETSSDIVLKVIVPDGLVCALSKSKPSRVLWQHKFEFPVVNAWQMEKGEVKWIDLFGGTSTPSSIPQSPLLYIGMHDKQLYIQESVMLQRKVLSEFSNVPRLPNRPVPLSIPWKPVAASALLPGINDPILQITDESQTTALSVLYASEYVNGNGFFLYDNETSKESEICQRTGEQKINITISTYHEEDEDDVNHDHNDHGQVGERLIQIQFFTVPIWHWWKEIIVISMSTAILVNVINRKFMKWWFQMGREDAKSLENGVTDTKQDDVHASAADLLKLTDPGMHAYKSRYLEDFEPLHCLGKGGFGIVFEARNKIDDCHYAIKRIPLPNKEESRERVMREVKALAKLDHQNIVRFFNAWLECPPPQWQEQLDAAWADKWQVVKGNSAVTVDLTGAVTPTSESKSFVPSEVKERSGFKGSFASFLSQTASFLTQGNSLRLPSENDDSFIVFEHSKNESEKKETELKSTSLVTSGGKIRPTKLDLSQSVVSSDGIMSNGSLQASPRMFLYIQMQLCRKESLKDWLQAANRDRRQALEIFHQIVLAVEYVHLQGLIHRDLKPSNIFFSQEGQIKVGDFGLVTAMAEGGGFGDGFESPLANRKASGKHTAMVGTQLYMSPEQLIGKGYSYKVDIYSLGLILFELLVTFSTQMERIHSLTRIKSSEFPSKFKEDFTEEHSLLELMLSVDPDERPTTIGIRSRAPLRELQNDLSSLCDDWHFSLPQRQRDSSFSKSSGSSSSLES